MKKSTNQLSQYYQVSFPHPEKIWFVVSILKSYDHLAFDRALDDDSKTFEFFVPADQEDEFLVIMKDLEQRGLIFAPIKVVAGR